MKFFNNKNKLIPVSLLVVFCFSFLLNITPARAQGMPVYDNVQNTWSTLEETKEQLESNWERIQNNFVDAVMMAAIKVMEYVGNKVAYDLAVTLASGNWGQSPLFHTKSMGDYWAGVAGDALGTALDSFGKGIGFNLCTLPDVKLDLALKMGLHLSYSEPKPSCSWQQLKDTYSADGITSKYWGSSGENFSKMFNTSLELSDTDIGVAIEAKSKIDAHALDAGAAAKAEREEGGGAKSFTSMISGGILTPAEVNKDMLVKSGKAAQEEKKSDSTATYMAAAMQKGSVQVLMNVASTFLETFVGTAMDNFLTKGMFPFGLGKVKCVPSYLKIGGLAIDTCVETKYDAAGSLYGGTESSWRQEAVTLFAEELLVAKTKTEDVYNLLAKFTICNDNPGPENCVLDQMFAQAIRQADLGKPLTIAQAVQSELLNKAWALISPVGETAATHNDKDCYANNFCYKNLQVLRKARVLPLGFELATLVPIEQNNNIPWTLEQVLQGYNVPSSPFYKLVNPNWVLKIPPARCKAIVYGDQLINKDTPLRQEVCADLQGCVEYDKKGNCIAFGYCLKEKNSWRINADYCDKQYATCKTYTNSASKTSSYLSRTLNNEMCDSENVGCRFYSNFKEFPGNVFASGTWVSGYKSDTQIQYGYYLNKNTETCVATNVGCTAFTTNTLDDANLLYFKKAPDYLRCYDTDNNPQNGVQWPQNLSDFNKLRPIDKNECSKYAAVCLPEEEGCNQYSLLPLSMFKNSVEEIIIGKFTPATSTESGVVFNDQCPSVCEGYDAYKELANRYSNGKDLVYIIPSIQAECAAQDEGCSAFVNLNVTSGGNVQTEYYSNLRLCMIPDQNKQKNFYTYEGRDGGGYKITGYTLLKNGEQPAQYFRDEEEKNTFGVCNETKSLIDGDCRAFRDDQGRVYYAFLSKTVVASDKCTPYRAIKSDFYDQNYCLGSFDGIKNSVGTDGVVFYDNATGFCIYNGLPQNIVASTQSSVACSQDKVSCRKYQGNTGSYVVNILSYEFDANTGITNTTSNKVKGWWKTSEGANNGTEINLSDESSNNIGKSLKVVVAAGSSAATRGFKHYNTNIQSSKTYSFSFLAKGTNKWNISLDHGFIHSVGSIALTDNWRRFEFVITNPILSGATIPEGEGAQIVFIDDGATGGYIFLDNVVLREIKDTVYLVKDKLNVPVACDENQSDSLPGPYLGCRAYKTPNSKDPVYLHNFNYLCRQDAVGCTKVFDTNNRAISGENKDKYIINNLWLLKNKLSQPDDFSGDLITNISGIELKCFVNSDERGCYVQEIAAMPGAMGALSEYFTFATIINPPKKSTPSYLVLNKNSSCNAGASGCTALGSSVLLVDGSRKYQDVFLRLIPEADNFKKSICNELSEGCDIWRSGPATHYFKDPEVYGNRLCEWKQHTEGTYEGSYKWTYKDTTSTLCSDGILPSFGSDIYNNEVGVCPSEQDSCTMFIDRFSGSQSKRCTISGKKCIFDKECTSDPNDLCADPAKEYYLLNNDKIKNSQKDCENGKVSLASGCVLLDQSSNPTKIWNTAVSYNLSESQGGAMVFPSSTVNNDANIILKTVLDRECSLWAYCSSYLLDHDADGQNLRSYCYTLGICDKAQEGATREGFCSGVVKSTVDSDRVLTLDIYQKRDTSWNAEEYTGYSLFNSYQIYDLQVSENNSNLVYVTTTGGKEIEFPAKKFSEYDLYSKDSGKAYSPKKTCRGYPEQNSPFDIWIINNYSEPKISLRSYKFGYSDKTNICTVENQDTESCDCDYVKYDYGGKAVYLDNDSLLGTEYEEGYCLSGYDDDSGSTEGDPCNYQECLKTPDDCGCGPKGQCTPLKSKSLLLGWEGFCLEKDTRYIVYKDKNVIDNTCLTWWPVERVRGTVDLNITDANAGYEISDENKDRFVCLYNDPVGSRTNSYTTNPLLQFLYDSLKTNSKITKSQELKVKVGNDIKSFNWFARDKGNEAFGNRIEDKKDLCLNPNIENSKIGSMSNAKYLTKRLHVEDVFYGTKGQAIEQESDIKDCYDSSSGRKKTDIYMGYYYCYGAPAKLEGEEDFPWEMACKSLYYDAGYNVNYGSWDNGWQFKSATNIYCKNEESFEDYDETITGCNAGADGNHFFFPHLGTNPDCSSKGNNEETVEWTHLNWNNTPGKFTTSGVQSFTDFYNNFYSFRGHKGGCGSNHELTFIGGKDDKGIIMKGLPDNAEAYVWQGESEVTYKYSGSDQKSNYPGVMKVEVEKSAEFLIYPYNLANSVRKNSIKKDQIVKIDVLTSAALVNVYDYSYDVKRNFRPVDLNRITFYNNEIAPNPSNVECKNKGTNTEVCIEIAKETDYSSAGYFTTPTSSLSVWEAVVSADEGTYFSEDKSKNYLTRYENNLNTPVNKLDESKANANGYGIQVIFDKNKNFKGVVFDIENDDGNEQAISAVVIVHYTDGSCAKSVQVSQEKDSSGNQTMKMKPITWRMKMDRSVFYSFVNETIWKRVVDTALKGWEYFIGSAVTSIRHIYKPVEAFLFPVNPDNTNITSYNLLNYSSTVSKKSTLFNRDFSSVDMEGNLLNTEKVTDLGVLPVKSMLNKMFATVKIDDATFDATTPQNAAKAGLTIRPPVIAAPITLSETACQTKKRGEGTNCDSFVLNAFSLTSNNIVEGNIEIVPNYPLIVRFYAWADPAQMPVRRIMVDDGVKKTPIVLESDSAVNKKPLCSNHGFCRGFYQEDKYFYQIPCNTNGDCVFYDTNRRRGDGQLLLLTGTCEFNNKNLKDWTDVSTFSYFDNPGGFGNTTDTGCREGYYNFYLSGYTESGMEITPKVQVLDNWGWCSGECKDAANGALYSDNEINYGCYADLSNRNDCNSSDKAWVNYNGNVIVE